MAAWVVGKAGVGARLARIFRDASYSSANRKYFLVQVLVDLTIRRSSYESSPNFYGSTNLWAPNLS